MKWYVLLNKKPDIKDRDHEILSFISEYMSGCQQ